jgi:hypothetical protein
VPQVSRRAFRAQSVAASAFTRLGDMVDFAALSDKRVRVTNQLVDGIDRELIGLVGEFRRYEHADGQDSEPVAVVYFPTLGTEALVDPVHLSAVGAG